MCLVIVNMLNIYLSFYKNVQYDRNVSVLTVGSMRCCTMKVITHELAQDFL